MISRVPVSFSAESATPSDPAAARCHLLTVNVEDYYQVGAFQRYIRPNTWYRFESRLKHNVDRVLDLLARHDTLATFFVLGWTAEKHPDVVQSIVAAGHEVASRGYLHQPMTTLPVEEIRVGLVKSKAVLEDVTGQRVDGFRLADGWLRRDNLWMLDEIASAGYRYDSSLMPRRRDFGGDSYRRSVHAVETPCGAILEIPLSTVPIAGGWLPVAGGNYHRQLPNGLMSRLVDRTIENTAGPFVMYFQVWELDHEQPLLTIAGRMTRMRHYRNLGKHGWMLPQYLNRYRFTSIRDHALFQDNSLSAPHCDEAGRTRQGCDARNLLWPSSTSKWEAESCQSSPDGNRLQWEKGKTRESSRPGVSVGETTSNNAECTSQPRVPVTIVIPCFNEESSLGYLERTLPSVRRQLEEHYETHVLFVDDCSTDETYPRLQAQYADDASVRIIRHANNLGVSGAILTGIKNATTEIVCSMDCDCTYDPHELTRMLPLMGDDIAMVTASPYHRDGEVRNVPNWRLFLSKGLSLIYRSVLRSDLSTWTSCFRIYRRSEILELPLEENGFLGTAEMAALLMFRKATIVEHPATLESRLFGFSKMKTVRVIFGHLRLLTHVIKLASFRQPSQSVTSSAIHRRTKESSSMTENMKFPSDQDSSGRTLGAAELELLRQCIESGTLTSTKGTFVKQLEQKFAETIGSKYAYACSSGTAAIHCAIAAINPEPGDEIITTSITDMGGLTPILYQGAIPVFADVDPETCNVTARTIERSLSNRTRAIIVTHLFGNPCEMDEILSLAQRHGIPVIEDAAQAFLTSYKDRYVGTLGDIGCFSLQQGKHITTGEGGIVTSDNDEFAEHMYLYVNKAWGYGDEKPDHYFAALNYRMTELQGAVAVAQLDRLEEVVAARVRLADKLTMLLGSLPGVSTPVVTPQSVHTYWKYCLRVDPTVIRDGVVGLGAALREVGVACAPRYIQKPAFKCQVIRDQVTFGTSRWPFTLARPEAVDYRPELFTGTWDALEHILVLAFNEKYTDEHIDALAERIRSAADSLRLSTAAVTV